MSDCDENKLPTELSRRAFLGAAAGVAAGHFGSAAAFAKTSDSAIPLRNLGRTNQKVSIIGLGGYHIGVQNDENESIKIIRAAIDGGINFLDNCWDYNDGTSEERMGKALENGYRQKVFLMSKIDGRNKKTAAQQIDESLKRLKTDHLDLMQFHEVIRMSDADKAFSEGGTMEALIEARKAGKIRFIGFTGHKSPEIHLNMLKTAAAHDFVFDTVQMPLNVMDAHFDSFEKLVVPELQKKNIGILGMKPMGGGVILKANAVTPVECLQYALSLPTDVVITGCDSMDVLTQALSTAKNFVPLTAAQREKLLAKTSALATAGKFEKYKSTTVFDGTNTHPEWMG